MSVTSDAFFTRARESLAGAGSEFGNGRYNNTANRSYYACVRLGTERPNADPVG